MSFKLSDLNQITSGASTDIIHIRNESGLDKKITNENLFKNIPGDVSAQTITAQTITASEELNSTGRFKPKYFFRDESLTQGEIFDAISEWLDVGESIDIQGGGRRNAVPYYIIGARKSSASTIRITMFDARNGNPPASSDITTSDAYPWSGFQIQSNNDPF